MPEKIEFEVTCDKYAFAVAYDDKGKVIYAWGEPTRLDAEKKAAELNALPATAQKKLLLDYRAGIMRDEMAVKIADIQTEADQKKLALERLTNGSIDDLYNHACEEDKEFADYLATLP